MPFASESGQRKVAIVTGGARRLGRAIALTLARAGFDLAITYRISKADAEETLRAIRAVGARAAAHAMDVRDEAGVYGVVAAIAGEFDRIDVLVNNAAVFETAPLAEISLEQWDAMFASNTRGPFLMAREALPHLKAAHGRIVNIGSLGGSHAWSTHGHYCASKAGLHMLTQAMAKAFAPEVSVNCVAPGYVEFEQGREAKHFASKTPMGRNAASEDVAEAVEFFATGPRFITGQILTVDGGLGL
jgi:3-oxoacyl-[acyl-carrier protein] reductase/pteridine reductase